jgi:hypothetical protein
MKRALLPKPVWGRPNGFAPTSVCVKPLSADLSPTLIAVIFDVGPQFDSSSHLRCQSREWEARMHHIRQSEE